MPDHCSNTDRPLRQPGTFDPDPVTRGEVRESRMGRRRAIVLIVVHLAIFAHILHWQLEGRTLSPLEPSEAMYTVATGAVNAGTILLIVSLISTIVLGRWFCGWACHLVAVQDLCAWMLKKVGIRPRPVRSRVLVWIPLLAGIHLFFFPMFVRWKRDLDAPPLTNDLMRTDFWETFPGPVVAILTFVVCGGAIVYLLGAKGFCTYACPYGGLFGVVERFSPARIRVTDACKGCGHCSAVCTSNVMVAKEVHEYGMVVDPGCMKCMDCVSVCPEDALYFGFGKPAFRTAPRIKHPKPVTPQFGIGEEIAMVISFSLSMIILRGIPEVFWPDGEGILYGEVPQLFALGVAAIVAFMSVFLWRVLRRTEVGFQKWTLKADGALTSAGKKWLAFAIVLHVFMLHSAVLQGLMASAKGHWRATAPIFDDVWRQAPTIGNVGGKIGHAIQAGDDRLELAESIGLFPDHRIHSNRAWFALCRGDLDTADAEIERALEIAPSYSNLMFSLAHIRVLQGRHADAWTQLAKAREANPDHGLFFDPEGRLRDELARLGMAQQLYDFLSAAPDPFAADLSFMLMRADAALVTNRPDEAFELLAQVLSTPGASDEVPNLGGRCVRFMGADPTRMLAIVDRELVKQPDVYFLYVLGIEAAVGTNNLHEAERIARISVGRWGERAPAGFVAGHPQILLAEVLDQRDEKQEAARLREQARRINPEVWK